MKLTGVLAPATTRALVIAQPCHDLGACAKTSGSHQRRRHKSPALDHMIAHRRLAA
jgi:hypothetical protein